jgi:DNA-binding transcriptional MerR regulator
MSNIVDQIAGYRIKAIASMSGLSTHAIRKWEERYQLLHPQRGPNGYRIYTEEELQLLLYVKAQLEQGESIGQLAQAGETGLRRLMQEAPIHLSGIPLDYQIETRELIQAARAKNIGGIHHLLANWINRMGLEQALETILFPVLRLIGDLWHQGRMTISSEHHVTRIIRQQLIAFLRAERQSNGPQALLACTPGEFHEIATLSTAVLLQHRGWQVTYLGPNVTFEVLHMALRRTHSDLMILSSTARPQPALLRRWLQIIAKRLQTHCRVMVGGPGFSEYREELDLHGIQHLTQVKDVTRLSQKMYGLNYAMSNGYS